MNTNRLHIIGGPGSGKTTLARQLAAQLLVPCYELDAIGYEGGAGAERSLDVRLADIRQIAALPGWVTEGIFLGWTAGLFSAAGTIIWLDLPWRIAGWRIFTRHVMAELRRNNKHSGWRKLYRFMQWCRSYYDPAGKVCEVVPEGEPVENRPTTEAYLAQFKHKLVHCRRPAEVQAIRMKICQPNP